MTTLTHSSPNACITEPHGVSSGWLARFRAWRIRRRTHAETMEVLRQLDSRDLRDLGINIYDFDAIARGSYRR